MEYMKYLNLWFCILILWRLKKMNWTIVATIQQGIVMIKSNNRPSPGSKYLSVMFYPNNHYTAICKNPTNSAAFCQWKFEVEGFHLKHCMDKVYTGLRTTGRIPRKRGWVELNSPARWITASRSRLLREPGEQRIWRLPIIKRGRFDSLNHLWK